MAYSRTSVLAFVAFLALAAVASAEEAEPDSIQFRLQQLEEEVAQLREENRRQRLQLESQTHDAPSQLSTQALSSESVALPAAFLESPAAQHAPACHADEVQRLAFDKNEIQFTVERLEAKIDQLGYSPTVSLLDKEWSATVTGAMTGEMIFAQQRPIIPSAIVLLFPYFGRDTPTVDIHGKSSKIGVLLRGPDLFGLKAGGAILAYFFGEDFLADIAGVNLIGGYAELKNDQWRFLFGRAGDLINPRQPRTVDINSGRNAGNLGFTRGQFRVERYLHPSPNTQVTAQFSLNNPIATAYDTTQLNLVEDTGWPNLEGRIVLGAGPVVKRYGFETRRFELGTSGLLGQLRLTDFDDPALIKVWAFGVDAKADLTSCFSVQAEFFYGQAMGNQNGGILQIFNSDTLEEVRTIGGWGDVQIHWTERLHSSFGVGIDDPLDSTVPPGLPIRNTFAFGNVIWDITDFAEVGFEVARWATDYAPVRDAANVVLRDNEAMIYRTRVVFRF